jgi:hypothetical protein
MDISKLSLQELKALAYDHLVQIEQLQINLKQINGEMEKTIKPEKTVPHVQADD